MGIIRYHFRKCSSCIDGLFKLSKIKLTWGCKNFCDKILSNFLYKARSENAIVVRGRYKTVRRNMSPEKIFIIQIRGFYENIYYITPAVNIVANYLIIGMKLRSLPTTSIEGKTYGVQLVHILTNLMFHYGAGMHVPTCPLLSRIFAYVNVFLVHCSPHRVSVA